MNKLTQKTAPVYTGLDISKATLQLHLQSQQHPFPNTAAGHRQLLKQLRAIPGAHVVCEATGGYERAVAAALHAAQIPVSVVNPPPKSATSPWPKASAPRTIPWTPPSSPPTAWPCVHKPRRCPTPVWTNCAAWCNGGSTSWNNSKPRATTPNTPRDPSSANNWQTDPPPRQPDRSRRNRTGRCPGPTDRHHLGPLLPPAARGGQTGQSRLNRRDEQTVDSNESCTQTRLRKISQCNTVTPHSFLAGRECPTPRALSSVVRQKQLLPERRAGADPLRQKGCDPFVPTFWKRRQPGHGGSPASPVPFLGGRADGFGGQPPRVGGLRVSVHPHRARAFPPFAFQFVRGQEMILELTQRAFAPGVD
jgi:hypothetical protein